MKRIDWLDFCRSLAIILVLYGHSELLVCCDVKIYKLIPIGGFIGVQLFFVLSGFLIARIILENEGKDKWLLNFLIRRWLRTVPNYFLFLIANLFLCALYIREIGNSDIRLYIVFLQNLIWHIGEFYPESWTLADEELFYLIIPILIYLTAKLLIKSIYKSTVTISFILIIFGAIAREFYVIYNDPLFDEGVRKVALLQMDSFAYGVLLQCIFSSEIIKKYIKYLRLISILILTQPLYSIFFGEDYNHSFFAKTYLFSLTNIGAAGLLILGYEISFSSYIRKFFGHISRISYSIYLVNLPIIYILIYIRANNKLNNIIIILLYIFITYIISLLVCNYFERFFLKIRDKYCHDIH